MKDELIFDVKKYAINDGPGILLIVEKQPSANTLVVTHEVEAALETLLVEIIEEEPSDTAWLVAMLQKEVVVAPLLETRIDILPERHAGVARYPVPVDDVLVVTIVGRQVESAAEPPDRFLAFLLCNEEAHVGM